MCINVKQPILDYERNSLMANKTNPDGHSRLDENNQRVRELEELRSTL